jgi:hypothetical protein
VGFGDHLQAEVSVRATIARYAFDMHGNAPVVEWRTVHVRCLRADDITLDLAMYAYHFPGLPHFASSVPMAIDALNREFFIWPPRGAAHSFLLLSAYISRMVSRTVRIAFPLLETSLSGSIC